MTSLNPVSKQPTPSTDNRVVVKSNRLVQASYRLSLVEQQIVLFAICKARDEQRGFSPDTPVSITAAEFAKQFGTNMTKVYGQLREAMDALYRRSVTIRDNHPKSGNPCVIETRWISDKAYIDGDGEIQITFAPKMIPYITRLGKEFTQYRLEKIGRMTSAHAVRLYEILIQWINAKGPRSFEIAALKDAMQLEDEYDRLDSFKRSVVDVAVKQINKFSDLKVKYSTGKKGRLVTHLIFEIALKPSGTPAPKAEKASSRPAKKKPVQLELPECITSPVDQHPEDPAVQAARKETQTAIKEMKRSRLKK